MRTNHVTAWPGLLAVLLAVQLLGGCQTLAEKRQSTRLEKALHAYELIMRWGDLGNIDQFALASDTAQSSEILENADKIRVTHYEVLSGPVAIDADTVMQQVLIRYIVRDTQVQKELLDRQVWRYVPEQKTWKRISKPPRFAL